MVKSGQESSLSISEIQQYCKYCNRKSTDLRRRLSVPQDEENWFFPAFILMSRMGNDILTCFNGKSWHASLSTFPTLISSLRIGHTGMPSSTNQPWEKNYQYFPPEIGQKFVKSLMHWHKSLPEMTWADRESYNDVTSAYPSHMRRPMFSAVWYHAAISINKVWGECMTFDNMHELRDDKMNLITQITRIHSLQRRFGIALALTGCMSTYVHTVLRGNNGLESW